MIYVYIAGALIEQNLILPKALDFTFNHLLLLSSLGGCMKRTVLKNIFDKSQLMVFFLLP